jgi:outer membrane protein TolC
LPSIGLLLGGGISADWLNLPVLSTTQQFTAAGRTADLPLSTPGSSSGSFYDWGAVLGVRQPLFDGGLSRESTALAQRRAEQSQVAIDQARQTIAQSVQTWWASHQAAAPQIRAAAAAAAAGEQAVRDALLRYRAGIAPITELLVAQRNLQVARASQAVATHRLNLSHAGLELETGAQEAAEAASGSLPTVP